MNPSNTPQKTNLVHDLNKPVGSTSKLSLPVVVVILVIVGVLGIFGGWAIAGKGGGTGVTKGAQLTEKSAGIMDKKRFPDKAEGILKEGGVDGEGNFHLERPGGESQNVYLTSSIVDLSSYVGKKIRVWGETFQAQKAGWLMDIGYVEIL